MIRRTTAKATAMAFGLIGAIALTTSLPAMAAPPPPAPAVASAARSPRAFARLTLPKRSLYDGESVPVTFQSYFRAGTGVTLTGTPKPSDPAFTLAMGEPAQGRVTLGGETYAVLTWKGNLSPAKVGQYALRFEVPATLEWQDVVSHTAPSTGSDDGLGDPFGAGLMGPLDQGDPSGFFARMQQQMQKLMNQAFQDMEVGPVQKKDLVLESPAADVAVLALPATGRPAAFGGAVGRFDLTATAKTDSVRAGEPVELRIVVHGRGNFDRVHLAGVPATSDLEAYAPTEASDETSKTFVQALVPRRAGPLQIQAVELAYFDPDSGRYVTARSQPVAVEVRPGQALAANTHGDVPDATSGPVLAANATDDGRAVASLTPLVARRGFWLAQLAPLAALVSAVGLVVGGRRFTADPRRVRQRQARRTLHRYRAEMDRAAGRGDAPAFFAAARGAVQQAMAARWDVPATAVTAAEIERRGEASDLETVRGVFEADAARFGVGVPESDLARWNAAVRREITHTEAT